MKRLIYFSMAALVVLAVSCKKDNKPDNDNPVKYVKYGLKTKRCA